MPGVEGVRRKSTRGEAVVARCTHDRPAEGGMEIPLPCAGHCLLEGILRVLLRQDVDLAVDPSMTP
ncbi:hypothetical protein ABZ379_36675 [Streptomyces canus]|uniref:hypothetical protein n=1 Tax=Streptomyces canus TaxID=58343 RepID=UPI0033F92881